MVGQAFKRFCDIVASAFLLVVLSPVLAVVGVVVYAKCGAPVCFNQLRPGRNGRLFKLVKFRTMTQATGPDGELLPDDERLTSFGQFLRASSLDELPELWNVLKGEMSLVGPRPLLPKYLDLYTERQARRHEVRPGITGWSQVNGRNALDWDTRLELDVWYVDNWSPLLDLKILLKTVSTVFRRSGIAAEGHATMPEFTGQTRKAE